MGKVIAGGTKEELKAIVTDKNTVEVIVGDGKVIKEEELKKIKGVISVEVNENKVKIDSLKEINNLDKIILYFTYNGIQIKNVESKVPDLETVFLTLTGRKLRD